MSEPLCLKCLFSRGRKRDNNLEEKFPHNCLDCVHATKKQKCIDGCGTTMVLCDFFGYWHNGDQPKRCFGYKKVKKTVNRTNPKK